MAEAKFLPTGQNILGFASQAANITAQKRSQELALQRFEAEKQAMQQEQARLAILDRERRDKIEFDRLQSNFKIAVDMKDFEAADSIMSQYNQKAGTNLRGDFSEMSQMLTAHEKAEKAGDKEGAKFIQDRFLEKYNRPVESAAEQFGRTDITGRIERERQLSEESRVIGLKQQQDIAKEQRTLESQEKLLKTGSELRREESKLKDEATAQRAAAAVRLAEERNRINMITKRATDIRNRLTEVDETTGLPAIQSVRRRRELQDRLDKFDAIIDANLLGLPPPTFDTPEAAPIQETPQPVAPAPAPQESLRPTQPVRVSKDNFIKQAIELNKQAVERGDIKKRDISLFYDAITNQDTPTEAQFAARMKLDEAFSKQAIDAWKDRFNDGRIPIKIDDKLAKRIYKDLTGLGEIK